MIKEFEIGKCYTIKHRSGSEYCGIAKYKNEIEGVSVLSRNKSNYSFNLQDKEYTSIVATPERKAWIENCITQGKWVCNAIKQGSWIICAKTGKDMFLMENISYYETKELIFTQGEQKIYIYYKGTHAEILETDEDLLKYSKKKYRVGTFFKSPESGDIVQVTNQANAIYLDGIMVSGGWVLYRGQWATIIDVNRPVLPPEIASISDNVFQYPVTQDAVFILKQVKCIRNSTNNINFYVGAIYDVCQTSGKIKYTGGGGVISSFTWNQKGNIEFQLVSEIGINKKSLPLHSQTELIRPHAKKSMNTCELTEFVIDQQLYKSKKSLILKTK